MKRIILSFLCVVTASLLFADAPITPYREARRNGALADFRIEVVDADGIAVSNANVRAFMGMNFRPKGYWLEGETDGQGCFPIRGKTCGDEIEVLVSKDGYYQSRKKFCFAMMGAEHEVRDGVWQPRGIVEIIKLKQIRNPGDLLVVGFGGWRDVPVTNAWIGVDLRLGDFVAPHGRGAVADFEVLVEWDGQPPHKSKICRGRIRFQESAGGYLAENDDESRYPYVYRAMAGNTYRIHDVQSVDRGELLDSIVQLKGKSFVFRTRCTVKDKEVVVANYGLIRVFGVGASWNGKPAMCLSGVFNPTPNDTNLEPMSYEAKKWLRTKKINEQKEAQK